jgi:DNA-binding NtrC family response regulator
VIGDQFRWQALFQHVQEPLFVLNRKRRLVFVNRAWETLTGVPAADARGWICRQRGASPDSLARVLAPPVEVLEGKPGRARRRVTHVPEGASPWWDIEFFPLLGADGLLCIIGKIAGAALTPLAAFTSMPEALRRLRDRLAAELPKDEAAKLWDAERLVARRERAVERFRLDQLDDILPVMRRVAEQVRLASSASSGAVAFIVGEAGTGKHWLARAIHQHGPYRDRAFAALDCAHLPPAALADALFGDSGLWRRPGIGAIYLKVPSHLPHDLQGRLREEIEEAKQPRQTDSPRPHLIAGSLVAPRDEVFAGRLLDSLHAVLTTLVIDLPPLRERQADLPSLVKRHLARLDADKAGAATPTKLTPAAWELLREHRWPGNVRELHTVLVGGHARAGPEGIDVADLPAYLRQAVSLERTPAALPERSMPLDQLLEQAERRLIEVALQRARGNKSRAAELLAIWRPRLLRRMEALGLTGSQGSSENPLDPEKSTNEH